MINGVYCSREVQEYRYEFMVDTVLLRPHVRLNEWYAPNIIEDGCLIWSKVTNMMLKTEWEQENVGGNENGTAISYATRISESICQPN